MAGVTAAAMCMLGMDNRDRVNNRDIEERFLRMRYRRMLRTMLRYAIEKFSEQRRKAYLHGKV